MTDLEKLRKLLKIIKESEVVFKYSFFFVYSFHHKKYGYYLGLCNLCALLNINHKFLLDYKPKGRKGQLVGYWFNMLDPVLMKEERVNYLKKTIKNYENTRDVNKTT